MDAPVIGAHDLASCASAKWEVSLTYRYQKSDNHFRGSHEEEDRQRDNTQVINRLHIVDVGARYRITPRWSVSASLPVILGSRSQALRRDGETFARTRTHVGDIGDMSVVARRWLLDPTKPHKGNVQFGWGVKVPTGPYGLSDNRQVVSSGEVTDVYRELDQSIQPGDGGWGVVLDMQAIRSFNEGQTAFYTAWSYLINPRGTNGTATNRNAANEQVMSVPDQYVLRTGASFSPRTWRGLSMSIGGRLEGLPPNDLIGPSDGFRRPGYGISVEPGIAFTRGKNSFAVLTPIALYRERQQSKPDGEVDPERHGDAAFADWVLFAGWWRKF
jgi:hypothetical protein